MKNCKESICLANVNGECAVEECKGVMKTFSKSKNATAEDMAELYETIKEID